MTGFIGFDFLGVLRWAGELVGVDAASSALDGLPLRRVPAVRALSRYL